MKTYPFTLAQLRPDFGRSAMTHAARAIALAGTLAGVLMLGGCSAGPSSEQGGPAYPDTKVQGETLDIQVVRDETTIRMTNTTARAFGKSRVWINRWFSRDIERFDVGQTLEFHLADFRDSFGEPFRAGGFFATQNPERLVQAQLETADSVVGLVVVERE